MNSEPSLQDEPLFAAEVGGTLSTNDKVDFLADVLSLDYPWKPGVKNIPFKLNMPLNRDALETLFGLKCALDEVTSDENKVVPSVAQCVVRVVNAAMGLEAVRIQNIKHRFEEFKNRNLGADAAMLQAVREICCRAIIDDKSAEDADAAIKDAFPHAA